MKLKTKIIAVIFLITTLSASVWAQNVTFEKVVRLFILSLKNQIRRISFGDTSMSRRHGEAKDNGNAIKIAVAIIKNTDNVEDANPIVFIQGGPGGSGIQTIRLWLNHPLRKKNDIVLFDERGTGFSKPRLCPELGKTFLEILAKNQSVDEDEKQKVDAASVCKQELDK